MSMDEKKARHRGRPVTHPKIKNLTTGEIYETYTEAGEAVKGSRFGVMKTCVGMQKKHKNHKFSFV